MGLVALAAALGFSVVSAQASPLSSAANALNDGLGPDGGIWRGTQNLVAAPSIIPNSAIDSVVDFAVFAPGGFQSYLDVSFPGQGFTDASGGSEFVYAFQVTANAPTQVRALNAGIDLGANLGTLGGPQAVVGSGDSTPTGASTFNDTSVRWDWGDFALLDSGETSDVLYYTSAFGPQPDQVTVASQFNGNQADSGPADFASPGIPEPSSIVICLLAACAATASRQRIS
ncbi:MAG: hypothetical protein AAGA92_12645 [Planctomycetota bacterium]